MRQTLQAKNQGGFTLLEILVVLTILIFIVGFALFVSLESYRGTSFRSERATIITLLQKARSQAMSNMCLGSGCSDGKAHGVHFNPAGSQYIIFQGASFVAGLSSNQVVPINNKINFAPNPPNDVIFNQLDGSVLGGGGSFTITDSSGHSSLISINSEGQISWTN